MVGHTSRDEGSAIILVLMVLVLATALGTTLAAVTLNNLQSARRSDEATKVLNAAEAGVSQAVTFMRQNGVAALRCRDTGTPDSPSWTDCGTAYGRSNPVGPAGASAGGAHYSAWVEEVTRLTSSVDQGVYRVHAVGTLAPGAVADCATVAAACRSITAEVVVSNFDLRGVYSKSIEGNSSGNATIKNESIFTTDCFPMRGRASLSITGFDSAHNIPAGVHTSGIIVNGPASRCNDLTKSIHHSGPCNPSFPYDQDSQGGSLGGTGCEAGTAAYPGVYGVKSPASDGVWGSKIESQQSMQQVFGLAYPPLTDDVVDKLKAIAEEDGTFRSTNTWPTQTVAAASRGVFFFDLSGKTGNAAKLDLAGLPSPFNQESAACNGPIIIVRNGNAVISPSNSDAVVGASVFLLSPGGGTGIATLNGGHLYGGIFAEAIDFSGNTYLEPPTCTDGVFNAALLAISIRSYSEDD
ncbi:hypothetical protein [Nocardioides panaciterrulae]|uniref:Type 4 fimbrial biogenesis protein PilX N-terminal domain-containing protein n=1 Tax=Nocardioides panaciterrulae TaxID=661492 RepID=A0A7Y9E854_9ACTN|nr:hypothetical protein [Nocardioides panaciterrulae]NYD42873.1 hypothetical protein [Nocardioides panaciterrulae]